MAMLEEGIRLAKRVAELVSCSRSEAEKYIEGGWVSVDGKVVEVPMARVQEGQKVELDRNATLVGIVPVTILLNKPPGYDADGGRKPAVQLLTPATHAEGDMTGIRVLQRHFTQLECVTPLETGASGLVAYTQDWRIKRKLVEDAGVVEHELTVDVRGEVAPDALRPLNRDGAKVSVNRQQGDVTGLRFAVKGLLPGQAAHMCDRTGLEIVAMKRLRIGRVSLSGMEPGQWRYLGLGERF
jgi:23S rRNA pseudouridine2604 synthase